jgi:hypothetical protein
MTCLGSRFERRALVSHSSAFLHTCDLRMDEGIKSHGPWRTTSPQYHRGLVFHPPSVERMSSFSLCRNAMTAKETLSIQTCPPSTTYQHSRQEEPSSWPEQTWICEQTASDFASIQFRQPLRNVKKRYLRGEGCQLLGGDEFQHLVQVVFSRPQ